MTSDPASPRETVPFRRLLFMPWRWKYLQYRPTPIGRLSVYCLHKFTGKMYGMPVLD